MTSNSKTTASNGPWAILGVACFFIAVSVALFFPALFLGKLIYGFDTLALAIPFHAEVLRSLAAGQWPLWMPDILGGMPGIASCNLFFMYPTAFFGSLLRLPLPLIFGLDAAFHVALAGTGMFLFLKCLRLGFAACLLGAFFFALSGSQVSQLYGGYYNLMEGIAWVPWAFWAAHKGVQERSLFAWGLCGATFALQILAGAAQLFVYTLAAVACFALSEARNPGPAAKAGTGAKNLSSCLSVLGGLGLSLGLAFFLSAPQLWLTLKYLPLSIRQGYTHAEFVDGSLGLSEALAWLVPGFFGWHNPAYHGSQGACFTSEYFGLLPWCLAAGTLAVLWRREKRVRWMVGLALAAFFFAQGRWTPFYWLFQHLPILAGFRIWSRTLFLLTFAVCVLAAMGWDVLRSEPTRRMSLRGAYIFCGLALTLSVFAWAYAPARAVADVYHSGRAFTVDPTRMVAGLIALARVSVRTALELCIGLLALLFLLGRRLNPGLALALALTFHALDQASMVTHFVGFMDPRAALAGSRFLQAPPPPPGLAPWRVYENDDSYPNRAVMPGYENLIGQESMGLQSYRDVRDALGPRTGDWLNLMGVRYVFKHSMPSASVPGDVVTIYENQEAFPRAWLVGRSLQVDDDGQAYRLLADPRFHPRDTVALKVAAGLEGTPPQGGVTWMERTPQAFSLAVTTDRNAALVLSNFWYPSWKADVDGRDTPVLEADGGLQAVLLGAGTHRVDFRFDPSLFDDALAAFLAGLVGLFGLWRLDAQARARGDENTHDR